MNRLDKKFKELKGKKKSALIIYVTAGDPSLVKTKELVFQLEKSGADIIELGVPFSDPLADGPTIQAASQRALKNNVCLQDIISLVSEIRKKTQVPIVFMTYYNPVFNYGTAKFVKAASATGVDGVIIPDLPPEEAQELITASRKFDFATIFLLSPTSSDERIKIVSEASRGFIYYVSLAGTTGARIKLPGEISSSVKKIKKRTDKPVCVGFGISNPQQAAEISKFSDGVIIGSAVIKIIEENLTNPDLVEKVGIFVKGLSDAIR